MADRRRRVAVVGGGISGMVAARQLALDGAEVVLVEAGATLGGKIRSEQVGGFAVDVGPDAFLARRPEAVGLCRELGMADDLVEPGVSGAAIWTRGRLRPLPDGLVLGVPTRLLPLARSGIVGPAGTVRAAMDRLANRSRFRRPGRDTDDLSPATSLSPADGSSPVADHDRSVAELVTPRLGHRVTRRLLDPLVGGIHAGPVTAMSAGSVFPTLRQAAEQPDDLMHALRRISRPAPAAGNPGSATLASGPIFATPRLGMVQIVDRLADDLARLGVTVHTGTLATSLAARPGTADAVWELRTDVQTFLLDGAVLALPAPAAAGLLTGATTPEGAVKGTAPEGAVDGTAPEGATDGTAPEGATDGTAVQLQRALRAIDYATVTVVTLAFDPHGPARRWRSTAGTGYLIPAEQGLLATGVTWLSSKWPHLHPDGPVLVRISAGRYGDRRCDGLDDTAVVRRLLGELRAVAGDVDEPVAASVTRWTDAFPQYRVGHLRWVTLVRHLAAGLPPMALTGAAYDGIGVPACIGSGHRAAVTLQGAMDRFVR